MTDGIRHLHSFKYFMSKQLLILIRNISTMYFFSFFFFMKKNWKPLSWNFSPLTEVSFLSLSPKKWCESIQHPVRNIYMSLKVFVAKILSGWKKENCWPRCNRLRYVSKIKFSLGKENIPRHITTDYCLVQKSGGYSWQLHMRRLDNLSK